jgi:hypothetical protein
MVMPVCFFILSGLVIMQSPASFRYQAASFLIARHVHLPGVPGDLRLCRGGPD